LGTNGIVTQTDSKNGGKSQGNGVEWGDATDVGDDAFENLIKKKKKKKKMGNFFLLKRKKKKKKKKKKNK